MSLYIWPCNSLYRVPGMYKWPCNSLCNWLSRVMGLWPMLDVKDWYVWCNNWWRQHKLLDTNRYAYQCQGKEEQSKITSNNQIESYHLDNQEQVLHQIPNRFTEGFCCTRCITQLSVWPQTMRVKGPLMWNRDLMTSNHHHTLITRLK